MPGGLLPCATNSGPTTSLFALAGQGGSGGSSSITISTLNITASATNNTGVNMLYGDGTSTILLQANTDGNGNTSVAMINQEGEDLGGGATLIVGNIGLIGLEESYLTGVPGFINADNAGNLFISSLSVSTLNGAVPGGANPNPAFSTITIASQGTGQDIQNLLLEVDANNIVQFSGGVLNVSMPAASASTMAVGNANGLSISGFPQPLITYGAQTLNAGGSTTIAMDREYTIPYYPFLTYRGTLPANTSTLAISTIDESSFLIFGEAGQSVQYMVVGN